MQVSLFSLRLITEFRKGRPASVPIKTSSGQVGVQLTRLHATKKLQTQKLGKTWNRTIV